MKKSTTGTKSGKSTKTSAKKKTSPPARTKKTAAKAKEVSATPENKRLIGVIAIILVIVIVYVLYPKKQPVTKKDAVTSSAPEIIMAPKEPAGPAISMNDIPEYTTSTIKTQIKRLLSNDPKVRVDATKELAKAGPKAKNAVLFLIQALDDTDGKVRSSAASALGAIRDGRAVEPLIGVLDDQNWVVRHRAVTSLKLIGDRRAIAPIKEVLRSDPMHNVRRAAQMALAYFGEPIK